MPTTAAAIKATMGLDTAPLRTGLVQANAEVAGFGKRMKASLAQVGQAFSLIGGGAIVAGIGSILNFAKELNPRLKQTAEQMELINRTAAGLSNSQLKELNKLGVGWDGLTAKVKGYFALAIRALTTGRTDTASDETIAAEVRTAQAADINAKIAEKVNKARLDGLSTTEAIVEAEKELSELLKTQSGDVLERAKNAEKIVDIEQRLTGLRKQQAADEEKAAAEVLAMRQKVADIDNDIADAQERDYESRLSTAGKILEAKRRIAEARAAQEGERDEVKGAEARKREADGEIELAELKRKKLSEDVADKLAGPDARRQRKRDKADVARATRTVLNRDRAAEAIARKNGRQLPKKAGVGELLGPPAPEGASGASEATLKQAVEQLSTIAANLGVRV